MSNKIQNLIYSISTGILLGLSTLQLGLSPLILVAFVPLLLLLENLITTQNKKDKFNFYLYGFLSFLIWHIISIFWISKATIPGSITTILLSSLIMSFSLPAIFISRKKYGKTITGIVFIGSWISLEYFLLNSQLSWPWMILGNAFADNIKLIQWYDTTGVFGGSLWILLVNYLFYILISNKKLKNNLSFRHFVLILSIIIIPILISYLKYYSYCEIDNPVNIIVLQPNIDPYNEKFNTPLDQQINKIQKLLNCQRLQKPDFIIAPETFLYHGIWINNLDNDIYVKKIKTLLSKYPECNFISGAVLLKKYNNPKEATITSSPLGNKGKFYDIFNSAINISLNSNTEYYHKIKLVPGSETIPYQSKLKFLKNVMLDLGGISGTYASDTVIKVFKHTYKDIYFSVPICYESVFGEFISNFVSNGAEILFIITNDGWWGNTPGYKQHYNFAKLRAIENRRSIARSANTGISCLINQKGEIIAKTEWWKSETIQSDINLNRKLTFYSKHGDYIAKFAVISIAIFLIISIFLFIRTYKPKV